MKLKIYNMWMYLTFGKDQEHIVEEKKIDRDTLVIIEASTESGIMKKVKKHFKEDWLFIYPSKIIDGLFIEKFTNIVKIK